MNYAIIVASALLFFSTVACEKVDKAFEAVDKAKNLKAKFEKKADEVKKDITGKAEAFGEKVKKSADNLGAPSSKDDKGSDYKDKSQKAEKEKGKSERENKAEKD
jgi:Skp family chaperone for outer membrane proteins